MGYVAHLEVFCIRIRHGINGLLSGRVRTKRATGGRDDPKHAGVRTLGLAPVLQRLDPADIIGAHPWTPDTPPNVDLTMTQGWDLIANSTFAPTPAELDTLKTQGFVVQQETFPTFAYGYKSIYGEDLPVYISFDSIAHAVHKAFDDILADYEYRVLWVQMVTVVKALRAKLGSGELTPLGAQAQKDIDEHLAIGLGLLDPNEDHTPVAGGNAADIDARIDQAIAAGGAGEEVIFGALRMVDWSQFKPRGHYADSERLQQYFRGTMWFGRINADMIAVDKAFNLVFDRRQTDVAMGIAFLFDNDSSAAFDSYDAMIEALIGPPDSLTPGELDDVLAALQVSSPTNYAALSDLTISTTLQKYNFGEQRILSQVVAGNDEKPGVYARVFNLFGQRYTVDSHVFDRVVYDRVSNPDRMMPDTLDVAFAVFQNNQALAMLEPELQTYNYQHQLESIWALVDTHDEDYWNGSLYTTWLSAIREMSPGRDARVPAVAKTEAWGERVLAGQLASWAELRHDTLLYVKQSYTNGNSCEFPDAYVDPYPAAFDRLAKLGMLGQSVFTEERTATYFANVTRVASTLRDMAEYELTGQAFTPAMMEFVNQAVSEEAFGCGQSELAASPHRRPGPVHPPIASGVRRALPDVRLRT